MNKIIVDIDKFREQIKLSHSETMEGILMHCLGMSRVGYLSEHDKRVSEEAIKKLISKLCIGCAYLNGTKCSNKIGCPCQVSQSYIVQTCNEVLEQMKGTQNE